MPGMTILGDNIRALRESREWSQERLAAEASRLGVKVSQQTVQAIEKGLNERSGKLPEIADVLGRTIKELRSHILDIDSAASPKVDSHPAQISPHANDRERDAARGLPGGRTDQGEQRPPFLGRKDLPILGSAMCGDDGSFEFNQGEPLGYVQRPFQLEGVKGAYSVYAVDSSMEPRYFHAEILYVNPTRPVTKNCFVCVQLKPTNEGDPPRALVKQFLRRDNNKVVLHQFNPKKDITIPADEIVAMHRILLGGEE